MLNKDHWLQTVKNIFDPQSSIIYNEVTEETKKKADMLHSILTSRLRYHIRRRIEDASKQNHWALHWVKENIGQVAAIMVLFDHVKPDLECMRDVSTTLLASNHNFKSAHTQPESLLQGAYIYYDSNDGSGLEVVRSLGGHFLTDMPNIRKQLESNKLPNSTPVIQQKITSTCLI